ncbi:hypothetical protein BH20VER1_BH20VER1_04370 [soil metagenome]
MKKSLLAILVAANALCGVSSLPAQTVYEPYFFSTYAGSALVVGSTNGPRNNALFNSPLGGAVDRNGDLYVADTGNHTIRKIAGGVVSTLAGSPGVAGSTDGPGATARFSDPTDVAVDNALNVYVADSANHTIRVISPAGIVTTLAGTAGVSGSANGTGSGARFNGPRGISVDSASNIYVADTFNNTIRKISPGGVVTTLAGFPLAAGSANGPGADARFFQPRGVTVDSSFNVYVADSANGTIRKITSSGVVTTLAGTAGMIGSADGMGAAARFFTPIGIAVNGSGVLFVADADNQLIRKITPSADVTTLGGAPGASGSTDGTGGSARFNSPQGVAVDSRGNLYVGDTGNNTIRFGQPLATFLANISTRVRVETGDNVLIGGFIVSGTHPKKVIVRAIGPSLPVLGKLENPTLELHGPAGLIASNDNWRDAPNRQEIIDSTVPPTNDLESAILTTLPANSVGYTAIIRGASGGTGVGLVEIFDLDRTVDSKMANISSRGFVRTGDNVMIGGFIVGGTGTQRVIVRAIGPSLPVPGALGDPTLELYNSNGAVIASNDNWRIGGQEAEIIASTVPPTNDLESAIVATLPPAPHTAIVRGKNETTGVGLVEVFALD